MNGFHAGGVEEWFPVVFFRGLARIIVQRVVALNLDHAGEIFGAFQVATKPVETVGNSR